MTAACGRTVSGTGGSTSSTATSTTTTSTTGTSSIVTGSTGTGLTPCGAEMCSSSQFCNDTSGACGKGPASALHCVDKGTVCGDGQFVCGCDGKIYMSDGCAALAGVGVDVTNMCGASPVGFFCGGYACPGSNFYCQEIAHPDQPGVATTYGCTALPAACNGVASCACLDDCGSGPQPPMCTIDTQGNATQHCSTG